MTRPLRAALCLALAGFFVACQATIPPRTPNSGQLATIDLKLALVLSDKTRASVKSLHAEAKKMRYHGGGMTGDFGNKPFDSVNNVFKTNFAEVVIVESSEQAKASGADIIAVLDYSASAEDMSQIAHILVNIMTLDLAMPFQRWWNPRKCDLVLDVTFMSPDQKQLDLLHAEAHRVSGVGSFVPALVSGASEEIAIRFENALAASQPLAAYARERAKRQPSESSPAAAAAPAVAAGPVSDVDDASYVSEEKPDNIAIVVGIEKYSSIPDASFAERDAQAVRKHLIALGYPERNILFLSGEQATRSAIKKYVEVWLPKNVKAESQVLFYFSGHGAPDPATKQAYLVPWDGDPKYLENTGYPIAQLYQSLGALKTRKVVVVLDSCFSGAGGRSVIAQGTRPLLMKIDSAIPASAGNLAVLSASAADEITGSDAAQGHGLFTYHLLRALNRTGGKATLKDAYAALLPDVQDSARRQNRAQTPQLVHGASSTLHFR